MKYLHAMIRVHDLDATGRFLTDGLGLRETRRMESPRCRTPQIVADAAHAVLVREARGFHGRFLIDEDVLREAGIADFSGYAVDPSQSPLPDLFLD